MLPERLDVAQLDRWLIGLEFGNKIPRDQLIEVASRGGRVPPSFWEHVDPPLDAKVRAAAPPPSSTTTPPPATTYSYSPTASSTTPTPISTTPTTSTPPPRWFESWRPVFTHTEDGQHINVVLPTKTVNINIYIRCILLINFTTIYSG